MIYNEYDLEYFDRIIKAFCKFMEKNIDVYSLYDTLTDNQQKELYNLIIQVVQDN